jgi:hypothetical protein
MLRIAKLAACAAVALGVAAAPAHAVLLVATNGSTLVRFDSATPGSTTTVPVTGLAGGETLVGIDFRPANGLLYGVGASNRVFQINPITGAATPAGAAFNPTLSGTSFGTDFNPFSDRIRQISNLEQNLRLSPDTGAAVGVDTPINPAGNLVAAAYSNNFPGTETTTLYDIDSAAGTLVIQSPPNEGKITTVGSLGLGTNLNETIGFDISADGVAYAAITFTGVSRLYTVNLTTGLATAFGMISNGATPYLGIAAAPAYLRVAGSQGQGAEGEPVPFTIVREGSTLSPLSVTYSTASGTATSGADFTPTSGSVSWGAGDASPRTVSVAVTDDAEPEPAEAFTVSLSEPSSGARVLSSAQGVIAPSDAPASPPGGGGTTTVPPDTRAPVLALTAAGTQKLRTARGKGIAFTAASDERCLLSAAASLPGALAKKLRIPARVGTLVAVARVGGTPLRLKLTEKAARAIRRAKRLVVTLQATCEDIPGNRSAAATRKVTLKR